jgi:glycosyltransferase involved in cell wall biosynthesis
MDSPTSQPRISIVLPCLNEEASIKTCLEKIQTLIKKHAWDAEVIVVNNNSTDRSEALLQEQQMTFPELRIVQESKRGYGSAYLRGFAVAQGEYLVMADIDQTYDFFELDRFIETLTHGAGLVIGNRFSGNMHDEAMPWHHRTLGNPVLSFLVRLFFQTNVRDVHCGMRAITRTTLNRLNLNAPGMEFASEMIIKAVQKKVLITEVPISYHPRVGDSKLRSFADGWRHLRFMLLYSPLYLFLLPGIIFFVLGAVSMLAMYFGVFSIIGIQFVVHPMFVSALLMIVGYQLITFTGFAKAYAFTHLGEKSALLEKIFRIFSIETASIIGLISIVLGITVYVFILYRWINSGFGSLNEIKNAIVGLTLAVLGVQTISAAFMTSMLSIKEY